MPGVCEGECMGCSPGMSSDLDKMPQLYEACEGWKSICGRAYNLKVIKGKLSVFLLFLKLCFFYCSSFLGMMRADLVVLGGGDSIININKL